MKQRSKSNASINTLITVGAIVATIGGWGLLSRNLPESTQLVAQNASSRRFIASIESSRTEQPRTTRIPRAVTRTRSSR